jgi:hypothetical protein
LKCFKLNYFYTRQVKFLTFADQTNYKYDRIIQEAQKSNFFSECIGKSLKDLDTVFVKKHNKFISENKRGYGYWIWKPQNIYEELLKMNKNDILFCVDSGCQLVKDRGNKILEYIELVNNDEVGILGFKNKFFSLDWIKQDVIDTILSDEKQQTLAGKKQIAGGYLVIRKTEESLKIIEEWRILCQNYHLISDEPSVLKNPPSFKEHRHDQAILDCLFHKYDLISSKDNIEDDQNSLGPFLPLRIK